MKRIYYKQIRDYTNKKKESGVVYFEMIGKTTAKVIDKKTGLCLGWVDSSTFLGGEKERLFKKINWAVFK